MRAALIETFGRLTLLELPRPDPGPGEVRVKVETCGICHSDLHAIAGDWSPPPSPPLIPGHEVVGRIDAVGEGVDAIRLGERVGVAWMAWSCGACAWCRADLETICPHAEMTGYTRNGGFADYMLARADFTAPLSETVDAATMAPVLCAGVTTYRGLKRAAAKPGDWVLVSGVGGLGHMAVQYARTLGYRVIATDVSADKLDLAKRLGAEAAFDARTPDLAERLAALTDGGPQAVLVTATATAAFESAVQWVRPGGTVVFIGLPSADRDGIRLSVAQVSNWEKTIRGSNVGSRRDLAEAIAFAASGQVTARVETVRFEDLPDALERLRRGQVSGRLVLDLRQG